MRVQASWFGWLGLHRFRRLPARTRRRMGNTNQRQSDVSTRDHLTRSNDASSDLINTKIPLVNRWEEHLAIAERQIQNAVVSNVTRRLASMGTERATVLELMKLVEIGRARLEDAIDVNEINIFFQNVIHKANIIIIFVNWVNIF